MTTPAPAPYTKEGAAASITLDEVADFVTAARAAGHPGDAPVGGLLVMRTRLHALTVGTGGASGRASAQPARVM